MEQPIPRTPVPQATPPPHALERATLHWGPPWLSTAPRESFSAAAAQDMIDRLHRRSRPRLPHPLRKCSPDCTWATASRLACRLTLTTSKGFTTTASVSPEPRPATARACEREGGREGRRESHHQCPRTPWQNIPAHPVLERSRKRTDTRGVGGLERPTLVQGIPLPNSSPP